MKMNKELVTPRKLRAWLKKINRSQNWLAKEIGVSSAAAAAWNRRGGISFRAQIQISEMMKEEKKYYGQSVNESNKR